MIELLVSLLIFAFGMLGLVGLQNRTLGYGQVSLYRSQATALADDILDRMRVDPVNAKAGNWATASTELASAVSGSSVAKTDIKEWKQQVEALLPTGRASIAVNAGEVTIDIQWDERGSTQNTWTTKSRL